MTALQFGHCPFLPAVTAGVRTGSRQWGQANSIFDGLAGRGGAFFFGELAAGRVARVRFDGTTFGGEVAGLVPRGFCR